MENIMSKREIFLCAISNISSGSCNEDCSFCTQSAKHKANIQRYKQKDIDTIIQEAKKAQAVGAVGFCLVTSGVGLDDKKLSFVCEIALKLKKSVDLHLIACNGLATKKQLQTLKDSGIDLYNHNLESSREFYKNICSTHSWEERYETCQNIKEVGLSLVCGGIMGIFDIVFLSIDENEQFRMCFKHR
jgi:biotin synthase